MNLTLLEFTAFAGSAGLIAALVALLVSFGRKILSTVFDYVVGSLFVKKKLAGDGTVDIVLAHLAKYPSIGLSEESFKVAKPYVRPKEGRANVFFRTLSTSKRLFFVKGAPVLLVPSVPLNSQHWSETAVMFLRGTVKWDQLLLAAAAQEDQRVVTVNSTEKRFYIKRYKGILGSPLVNQASNGSTTGSKSSAPTGVAVSDRPVGWDPDDLGEPLMESTLVDHMSLGPELQELIRDAKFWHTHQEWYRERGIPWRRGYLLHGVPGTGKTMTVRAIAELLDLPVHIFDIGSMTNADFIEAWLDSRKYGRRIILLEDLDRVFYLDKNVRPNGLSFDALLNAIGGIETEPGLILVVTTNNLDHIDPALGNVGKGQRSTRPGRIDRLFEIKTLTAEGRLKMARRIVKIEEDAQLLTRRGEGDTAAQFQERCMRHAMALLWGEEPPGEDEAPTKRTPIEVVDMPDIELNEADGSQSAEYDPNLPPPSASGLEASLNRLKEALEKADGLPPHELFPDGSSRQEIDVGNGYKVIVRVSPHDQNPPGAAPPDDLFK